MEKVYMRYKNDCYKACLATVLGLDYEQVPRFIDDDDNLLGVWQEMVNDFLDEYDLQCLSVVVGEGLLETLKGFYIVSGPSNNPEYKERGFYHAVVYLDGGLYHDPNPHAKHGEIIPTEVDLLIKISR